jgi:hydroxymethylpyrimidine pyrophosphatase-like HAD family hydrolase
MTAEAATSVRPTRHASGTDLYHPIFTLGELLDLVTDRLTAVDGDSNRTDAVVDAYLGVASICQVLADHSHRDIADVRRVRKYARRLHAPLGAAAGSALGAAGAALHLVAAGLDREPALRLDRLEAFAQELAEGVWGLGAPRAGALLETWSEMASPSGLPLFEVAIPPRSFFTFDQRPEDCIELAVRYAERRRDRGAAVLIVGVRTSGCFLAPIVAAGLRRSGYRDVRWTSWRPGQQVLARDRRLLRWAAQYRADVLVVDDPPTSGGSVGRTAEELTARGIDASRITLMLPLFPGARRWERRLARWSQVRLEWRDWAVHSSLAEAEVRRALDDLMPERVVDVVRIPSGSADDVVAPGARRHIAARYRVRVESSGRRLETRDVLAMGVGLGMFGESAGAVGRRLTGLVPRIYGLRDGLLYREWLPYESHVREADPQERGRLARIVARYAAQRADTLRVPEDVSSRMSGHDAVWEQAGRWLGSGFGRLALPMRPLLHTAARKLTRIDRASLIDSDMGVGQWFEVGGGLVKRDFAEATFVYQLPMTYDAAYDVAAAAARRMPDEDFGRVARAEFERLTGTRIHDVRWFLYQAISELDRRDTILRASDGDAQSHARLVELVTEGERNASALHRAFLASQFLDDVETPSRGEVVAIDVDGVLEGGPWWYAAPSAASLMAVRALLRHGYRPVLATGRSLPEAVRRCRDYRLAGAVAEYGAAVHDVASGESRSRLGADEIEDLNVLRLALARTEGVELDPGFQHAIRAFGISGGRRVAIPPELAANTVAACGISDRIRIEQGWAQTDFVPVEVDKRTGLQQLVTILGIDTGTLALAVGDSPPDVAMFRLARMSAVPANGAPGIEKGTGAVRCRNAYGAGLAEAVGMLIGHRPGTCPDCALTRRPDASTALLLTLLAAQDRRGLGKVASAARAWRLVRS